MRTYPGINIQYPISRKILDGSKTIETRTYPIPSQYIGVYLAFVETPGKLASFKSRIVGLIVFRECFKYDDEQSFYKDFSRHKVDKNSVWRWDSNKPKWGWVIEKVKKLPEPQLVDKRVGIVFTKCLEVY